MLATRSLASGRALDTRSGSLAASRLISGEFRSGYDKVGSFTEAVLNALGSRSASSFPGGGSEWYGNERIQSVNPSISFGLAFLATTDLFSAQLLRHSVFLCQ